MALLEKRLDCTIDKVQTAIDRLKAFEPHEGYWLAYSGGKDSGVIKRLAEMAGVKFEAHYSCTSVDPPELVRFIKSQKDVYFDIPRYPDGKPITMWNLIPKEKYPPTRTMRYCCKRLKESSGVGRITVTGVRREESRNRAKNQALVTVFGDKKSKGLLLNLDNDESRRMVEQCYRTTKTLINPIIDWTDSDVWEFHKVENVPYCELYGDITKRFTCTGKKRLGCIGCPMSNAKKELQEYPKYKAAYIRAFDKMLLEKPKETIWKSGEDVMEWWINGGNKTIDPNQMGFELEE